MSQVDMALKALNIVRQMSQMINLVPRVLDHDVGHLVALLTCPCVHLSPQERPRVCPCEPFKHVARPIQVGTEFPDDTGFGMTLDTVSHSVNGPGMG